MSTVILHIGTHKTATTTIQNTFAANRDLLARQGLDYPRIGKVAGHHGLVTRWHALPEVFALPDGAERGWERVGALARTGRVVFLSSEEFSRGLPEPRVDFGEIRHYLSRFDRVRVICTLRDQLSYLQSIYLELAKNAAPPPWSRFLAKSLETGFGAGLFLDFAALDHHLRAHFARTEIGYLDFASASAEPGGMIGAMLRASGIALDPGALRPVEGGCSNVSPEPLAAWAAHQVSSPAAAGPELLRLAAEAVREEARGVPTTLYTRAEEARVLSRFAAANARFSERIAQTTPGFCITARSAHGLRLTREDLGPGFWLRLARRIHMAASRSLETA